MADEDRENIAALLTDQKYLSLRKLENNTISKWIREGFHEENMGRKAMKQGGVQMMTAIHQAIHNTFIQKMQTKAEEKEKRKTLNGLGW